MEELQQATQSELEIMQILWQSGNAASLAVILSKLNDMGKQWKYNTVITFLTRLEEKGMVSISKDGRNNIYTANISEEDFRERQTQSFIQKVYDGNVKELVASLLKQERLTPQDIEDLNSFWKGRDTNE